MNNNIDDFEEIRARGEVFYQTIGEVNCAYFQGKVVFNAQGLEHLTFRARDRVRTKQDQYMRFKLLHLAPEILKRSHLLQGYLQRKKFEKVRVHSRTEMIFKLVTYYEFIAVIKRDRVKVVVKQIENGERFFWSLIPFWGMDINTMTRLFHEGVPEED